MKHLISLLLIVLLFAACQPTPEQEIVMNKTEGRLEEVIEEDAVGAYAPEGEPKSLRSRLGVPEHVSDSCSGHIWGGMLEVIFDADVEIPDVERVPVYTAAVNAETPEQIEGIICKLLGDGPYYAPNGALAAKLAYDREVLRFSRWLEAYENGAIPQNGRSADDAEYMREDLAHAVSELQKLEIGPMEPWTGSFSDPTVIKIANAVNDRVTRLNEQGAWYIEYRSGTVAGPMTDDWLRQPNSDAEREAAERAEAFIRRICDGDLQLIGAESANDAEADPENRSDEYRVAFIPVVSGIPVTPYYDNFTGSDTAKQAAGVPSDYAPEVPHPCIQASLCGETVTMLFYRSPITIRSTENENVQLMPFPSILDTFKTQIFRSIYMDAAKDGEPEKTFRMRITAVGLSYMCARKPDSDEYYLLPVWDFFGSTFDAKHPEEELDPQSNFCRFLPILTVNAIDGNIVNRHSGY